MHSNIQQTSDITSFSLNETWHQCCSTLKLLNNQPKQHFLMICLITQNPSKNIDFATFLIGFTNVQTSTSDLGQTKQNMRNHSGDFFCPKYVIESIREHFGSFYCDLKHGLNDSQPARKLVILMKIRNFEIFSSFQMA